MAGSSAGSIFVDLLLRDAQYNQGWGKARRTTQTGAQAITAAVGTVATAFATTAAASITAITALSVAQYRSIDASVKFARSLSLANENLQAFVLLADEAGVSQESLVALITRGQKAVAAALKDTSGTAAEALASLNLEAEKLARLAPDQQFIRIAEAIGEIENPTQRNAKAFEVLGKSGFEVTKMLEYLKIKLAEAKEFNDRFNISVSNIDARTVEEANDTFGRLGKAISGLGNTIAVETAPLVTELSNRMLNAGITGKEFTEAVQLGLAGIASLTDTVIQAVIGLEYFFVAVAKSVNDLYLNIKRAELAVVELRNRLFPGEEASSALRAVTADLEYYKAYSQAAEEELKDLEARAGQYQDTQDIIRKIQDDARQRAATAEAKNPLGSVSVIDPDAISKDLKKSADSVKLWGIDITESAKRAASNIQDQFADFLFDPFADGLQGMAKGFVDVLRRMVSEAAASKLASLIFGTDKKGEEGLLGGIAQSFSGSDIGKFFAGFFADGGFIPPGQFGIAGEEGAEIIAGGRTGATVTPMSRVSPGGNTYNIDARGADQGAVTRLEAALLTLAGPGVIEKRVKDGQTRGEV